ncbi:MAG: hypothetical protein AUG51_06240 [Acidobacteria bacterium 13_1_20CM_3_53_8]|nr:MAG: hypothetical protein AUG51_06240 [Acidobacteria bacterium 13_1_20CM_3_53_8]
MLTAIRQQDSAKVCAWEAEREDKPFICHCCHETVTLRKGEIKAPHFAHQPPVTCEYGTGEGEAHRRCKIAIYEELINRQNVTKCEIERDLGTVRPDVSAYINGVPVAIEVQLSNLSLGKIKQRTAEYARKGIYVLWLPVYSRDLKKELYAPRPWELWLQEAYFGRVYYWLEGLKIQPVHFRDYYINVNGLTHDYYKLSRRKVPIDGRTVMLTEDFSPVKSVAHGRSLTSVPQAKLFVDKQQKWYSAARCD